jgi:Nucleoside 2-deoxyribosyltransferase like
MHIVITAPNEEYSIANANNIKLFLAGGITNCPNWQSGLLKYLEDLDDLTIYNPRRPDFPINDPKASEAQITWEYLHLLNADVLVFWFSNGSLNPIVLFELEKYSLSSTKPLVIGMDREYQRATDVIIQTQLSRPDIKEIYTSIPAMAQAIHELLKDL